MFKSLKFLNEGFDRRYLKEEVEEELFHNDNGTDYVIVERSKSGKNALLRTQNGKKWIIAWNCPKSNEGSWGQGHYFFDEHEARDFWEKKYLNEDWNIEDQIDAPETIGKLNKGDKFINRNGAIITITDPTKDGRIQYCVGDECRSGPEKSIQQMLYRNNYTRMSRKNESVNIERKTNELPYVKWVKKADDGSWVMWGGSYSPDLDKNFLDRINHPKYPNPDYNIENQYVDAIILPVGRSPEELDEACGYKSKLKKKSTNEAVDDRGVERYGVNGKWWYFTTHGVQPGSVPKGIEILDVKEGKNKKGTIGTFFASDRVLNTSELNKYDIKEEVPVDESLNEDYFHNIEKLVRDATNKYKLDSGEVIPAQFNSEYINDMLDEFEKYNYSVGWYMKDPTRDNNDLSNQIYEFNRNSKPLVEDTVKQNGKWVNKGKEGTHGKFATKKAADAQRKAMFASGYKVESLNESSQTWADEKYTELMAKDKDQWDQDDWDAYNYIMQVWGEMGYFDESLAESLDSDFEVDIYEVDDELELVDKVATIPLSMSELKSRLGNSFDAALKGVTQEHIKNTGGIDPQWTIGTVLGNMAYDKFMNSPKFDRSKYYSKGSVIRVNNMGLFPTSIELLQKKLGKALLPPKGYYDESLNEASESDTRIVKTGLSGAKNNEILRSILGQMSDGIWENSPAIEPYWMFADVDTNCNFVIKSEPYVYSSYISKSIRNPYYQKSDADILKYFANKLKQIVREFAADNDLIFKQIWNKDCQEICDYLGYREEITIGDAFNVYQALR